VREVLGEAVARARDGGGPALIEASTYRMCGHSCADPGAYRPAEEVADWATRDPLLRQAGVLAASGVAEVDIAGVSARVGAEVDALAVRVLAAPAPNPATAWTDMWSDGTSTWRN
jgi:pyruvate dehydrogenase E1 component alpha subunit